jgi:hypothetical protein
MCNLSKNATLPPRLLPTGEGQRNGMIFKLARHLSGEKPGASVTELEPLVRRWHEQSLSVIKTKDWKTTWQDFQHAYQSVRYPILRIRWNAIVSSAPTFGTLGYKKAAGRLVQLCAAIQAQHGPDNSWPLACRKAASVVGVSHMQVARILKRLEKDHVIELAKPANRLLKLAAEYRFLRDVQPISAA